MSLSLDGGRFLSLLAKKASFYDSFSESQKNFIDLLEPMNIESRYPSNKDRLLRSLTKDRCMMIVVLWKK